jgi:hypothetical protein
MKTLRKTAGWTGIIVLSVFLVRGYLAVIWIRPAEPTGSIGRRSFPARTSTLAVPVEIQMDAVAHLANQLAPREISGTHRINARIKPRWVWRGLESRLEFEDMEVAHVDYRVSRGSIQLGASKERLIVRVPLSGRAKAIPGGSTAEVKGTARGSTTLAVGSDFNLNPSVDLAVDLDRADLNLARINVLGHNIGISIPIRDLAQQKANDAIKGIKGQIAAELSKAINLRDLAEKAWSNLPGTVRLPGVDNAWLTIQPKAIQLDGPHAANGVVSATLGLQADLATHIQTEAPANPSRSPLPKLTGRSSDGRFHLALPVAAQISELNRQLGFALRRGGKIRLSENHEVTIDEASLFPRGNRLYVKVRFEGSSGFWLRKVKGTLILGAVPRLDRDQQTLHFDELELTAETRNALLNSAAWMLQPFIVHELQKRAALPLAAPFAQAKKEAYDLARKVRLPAPLHLDFAVDRLALESVAVCGDQICVQFDASGMTKLTYGTNSIRELAAVRR